MVELEENQKTELLILIDEFIHDISGRSIIETTTVIDRLLDVRNLAELIAVPN
jgi:hypothetical protein